ncbi:ApeI family dehydratase [Thalassotalea sp. PLHSN55]|uniref:ApeI family dehydratase n=1 Tax=Thalassotalea sp. PLHSN55 TaxID=3435888 RepID=UPI003F85972A
MSKLTSVLPKVIDSELVPDGINVKLYIDENIDYFKGHFPEAPVLPGVVQLDWAIYFARKHLDILDSDVKNVEVLKFQVIVRPNMEVQLNLVKKSDTKFTFTYLSEKGAHASGRIVLEEK